MPHKRSLFAGALALTILLGASSGIAQEIDVLNEPFEITANNMTQEFTLAQLGVSLNNTEEVSQKNGFSFAFANLFRTHDYEFNWSPSRTSGLLREAYNIDKPANAEFVFTSAGLDIQSGQAGHNFDIEAFMEDLLSDAPRLGSYELELEEVDTVTRDELLPYLPQVQSAYDTGLALEYDGERAWRAVTLDDLAYNQEDGFALMLKASLTDSLIAELTEKVDRVELNVILREANLDSTSRVSFDGELRDGRQVDPELSAQMLKNAFKHQEPIAKAVISTIPAQIFNETGLPELDNLQLIAEGVSNYHHSSSSRIHNVEASLSHMNGVLVPAGKTFYFNSFLDPRDWVYGYVIMGNKAVPGLGGGTCQVSTTVARAMENAGLDTSGYPHSWYLDEYYAAKADGSLDIEGVGRDTTVYLGGKNFVATNTTSSPILMLTRTEDNFDAIVQLYGIDDRQTKWTGPITRSNMTDETIAKYGSLGYHQVAWKIETVYFDGREPEVDWKLSSYAKGYVDQMSEEPQTYTY